MSPPIRASIRDHLRGPRSIIERLRRGVKLLTFKSKVLANSVGAAAATHAINLGLKEYFFYCNNHLLIQLSVH